MIVHEENREYNLDITEESCGVIANSSGLSRSLPFFVYCTGQIGGKKDYYTKTKTLSGVLLILTTAGSGSLEYQGQSYLLQTGDLFLLDCTQYHEYHTVGKHWTNYYIRFDGSAARIYHDYIHRHGFHIFSCENWKLMQSRFSEVINLCTQSGSLAPMQVSSLITQILTDLAGMQPHPEEEQDMSAAVTTAKHYIETHYHKKVTLEEIAQACLLSPYHLSRLFKAQLGDSPHAFLNHVRIENAKRLLLTTQLSVQDICFRVGFSNPNILIRSFKNAVGMTPTAFRSKHFL